MVGQGVQRESFTWSNKWQAICWQEDLEHADPVNCLGFATLVVQILGHQYFSAAVDDIPISALYTDLAGRQ